jgi:hypothetical protein
MMGVPSCLGGCSGIAGISGLRGLAPSGDCNHPPNPMGSNGLGRCGKATILADPSQRPRDRPEGAGIWAA